MGRGPVHLPAQTVGFCRSREAKGRANRSFLEHDGNRDAVPYALCGREIRCVNVEGKQRLRDSDSTTTVALSSAGRRCGGTHPLRHPIFP